MARQVVVAGEEVSVGIRWFLILIAVIVFVLLGFGVTPFGLSAIEFLAWGLAFFAAGHL